MRPFPYFLLMLCWSGMPVHAADIAALERALEAGRSADVLPALQAAAAQDDARAITLLAALYQRGEGVAKDPARAIALYRRAAELGDAEAQFNLGNIYLLGEGIEVDEAWALTFYRQAASQGHELAARNMQQLYRAAGVEVPPLPAANAPAQVASLAASDAPEPRVVAVAPVSEQPLASTTQVDPRPEAALDERTARGSESIRRHERELAAETEIKLVNGTTADSEEAISPAEQEAIRLAEEHGVKVALPQSARASMPNAKNEAGPLVVEQPAAPTPRAGDPPHQAGNDDVARQAQEQFERGVRYQTGDGVPPDEAMAITLFREAARNGHAGALARLKSIYTKAGLPMPDLGRPREVLAPSRGRSEGGHPGAARKPSEDEVAQIAMSRDDAGKAGAAMAAAVEDELVEEPIADRANALPEVGGNLPPHVEHRYAYPTVDHQGARVPAEEIDPPRPPDDQVVPGSVLAQSRNDAVSTSASAEPETPIASAASVAGEIDTSRGTAAAVSATDSGQALSRRGLEPSAAGAPARGGDAATRAVTPATLVAARAAVNAGDYARAAVLFGELADAGDAEAQANLGYMYYRGEGLAQDKAAAIGWYRKAAAQGNRDAQYNLAVAHAFGDGVPQDDREAVVWYRRAAERGSAIAQYSLGVSYALGEGIEQSDSDAVRWYRAAAEQGYPAAQYSLAYMYRAGKGVAQNDSEALRWFLRAAENGHASAQYSLGYMYRSGKGVARNDEQARQWYRLAAEQGHPDARADLATLTPGN